MAGPAVYLRGRSVSGRFGWHYWDDELEETRGRLRGSLARCHTVRMMFNDNRGSDAPVAAQRRRELVGQAVAW